MKSNNENHVQDSRIYSWEGKKLSIAGRMLLLYLVLYNKKVYWSNIFILPKKVIKLIKQQFSSFYGVEVITHEVSSLEFNILTKSEGGLGLKRVAELNKATIMRHTWTIFAQVGSIGMARTREKSSKSYPFKN